MGVTDDPIDRLIEQWRRERPDLDAAPMALFARLFRAAHAADRAVERGLAAQGLQPGWFDVLSALRRSGDPYRLSAGRLTAAVMLSTGGMTKRLDRMAAAGLLRRTPDPEDRRGVLVELTAEGLRTVDRAVDGHVAAEAALLTGLTDGDRTRLETLLTRLDRSIREATAPAPRP